MKRLAVLATILTVATSCDKAKELAGGGGGAQAAEPPPAARLDLSKHPTILFQVFGERDDPKLIPVAAIARGALKPIVLSADGWRQFDALYTRSGATYSIYRDGRPAGSVRVRQGMWEKETEPVYTLANCQLPTPIAAVTLQGVAGAGYTVEMFASNAPLGAGDKGPTARIKEPAIVARGLGAWIGKDQGITKQMLDSLDFRGLAVPTGVSREPTIVSSFIDPHAEDQVAAGTNTVHVFAIGDKTDLSYKPTFAHAVNGPAAKAEFRRYVDHLDIDNDGVDEIVLEGWQYGGDTFLIVLAYRDGHWTEIFRSRPGWCLDKKRE